MIIKHHTTEEFSRLKKDFFLVPVKFSWVDFTRYLDGHSAENYPLRGKSLDLSGRAAHKDFDMIRDYMMRNGNELVTHISFDSISPVIKKWEDNYKVTVDREQDITVTLGSMIVHSLPEQVLEVFLIFSSESNYMKFKLST